MCELWKLRNLAALSSVATRGLFAISDDQKTTITVYVHTRHGLTQSRQGLERLSKSARGGMLLKLNISAAFLSIVAPLTHQFSLSVVGAAMGRSSILPCARVDGKRSTAVLDACTLCICALSRSPSMRHRHVTRTAPAPQEALSFTHANTINMPPRQSKQHSHFVRCSFSQTSSV